MAIPGWAAGYIGLPFKAHGRDRAGMDCWGLVRLVLAEQFAVFAPSFSANYESTEDAATLGALITDHARLCIKVPPGQEKCGDVIVLRMKGAPMHVGMVLGDNFMLHIERGVNSSMESYKNIRWRDRVYGFYEYGTR